jgi:hypothetical protein
LLFLASAYASRSVSILHTAPSSCDRTGNMQFPTIVDARFVYKAPIEPKDVDSIVDYLSVSEARIRPEIVGLLSS